MSQSLFTDRVCSERLRGALDDVAKHHVDHDARLLKRLRGEMQQQSTRYSQSLLQYAPTSWRLPKCDRHAVDLSFDALNPEVTEVDGAPSTQPHFRIAVPTEFATIPLAISAEVEQAIPRDASLDEFGPRQLSQSLVGKDSSDRRSQNRSERRLTNDLIAQLAPRFTTALNDQNTTAVLKHVSATSGDEFAKPLVDNQTSDQIRSQADAKGDERQRFSDFFHDGGKTPDICTFHVPYQGHITEGMISSDLGLDQTIEAPAIGSIIANFGAQMAQGDKRALSADTPTNFDRDGAKWIDGGAFSGPSTNQPVQDALAAAIEQVERLTTAVRRAIDELERARGPVQPALPALPLNFGSFRLS